jgi:hypothetical protein
LTFTRAGWLGLSPLTGTTRTSLRLCSSSGSPSPAIDNKGDVWCNGCGVQLYSLRDSFTCEHRAECPVLNAQALVKRLSGK